MSHLACGIDYVQERGAKLCPFQIIELHFISLKGIKLQSLSICAQKMIKTSEEEVHQLCLHDAKNALLTGKELPPADSKTAA